MNISESGMKVLERRYLKRDDQGTIIETPEELFRRVAHTVAASELPYVADSHGNPLQEMHYWEEQFYRIMTDLDFLPNSPTLMNAGLPLGQLSACFVLPVEDSIDEIFMRVHDTAMIHKSGGGTGFSFSRIRPDGTMVSTTKGKASGPLSFMHAFDAATGTIAQGGKRRGANMGMLRIDHPDILQFIKVKNDLTQLNNFNLSVAVTEKFMEALRNETEYELIDPHTGEIDSYMDAKVVWNMIIESAWKTGEPGIIFIDRVNESNFLKPLYGEIEATNPCGEQPLLPWEACNLGSINLANFVLHTDRPAHERTVDYARLQNVASIATRFLDDVIDANNYPLPQIAEMCKATRKIGLGVMGFADMLHLLQIPYDSETGLNIAKSVMQTIQDSAHTASHILALERGAYPAYYTLRDMRGVNMSNIRLERNAAVTTIAPTGSISAIANVSSGIEPLFANVFYKNVMDNTYLPVVNEHLMADLREDDVLTEELEEKIKHSATIAHMEEIPEYLRRVYVCAHDISPVAHVQMQAMFQRYVDNAISKTVNFNEDATQDDIRRTYDLAYKLGCKGITVYRNNCRKNQVLNVGTVEKKQDKESAPATMGQEETTAVPVQYEDLESCIVRYTPDEIAKAVEYNYPEYRVVHVDPVQPSGSNLLDIPAMVGSMERIISNLNLCKIIADDKLHRDLVQQAHDVLDSALSYMTPGNIQKQKRSINEKTLDPELVFRVVSEFACDEGEARKMDYVLPREVVYGLYTWCLKHIQSEETFYDPEKVYDPDKDRTTFYGEFHGDMEHFVGKHEMTDDELSTFIQSIVHHYRPDMDTDGTVKPFNATAPEGPSLTIRPRPEELSGKTKCVPINCGKLYVTVNHDKNDELFEVFTTNGKGGGCPAQSEAVCRLASLLLRSGVSVDAIIRQLRGIKCTACLKNPNIHVLSCPDAIGRELEAERKKLEVVRVVSSHDVGIQEVKPRDAIMSPFNSVSVPPSHPMPKGVFPPELSVNYHITATDLSDEDESQVGSKDTCPQCGAEMQHIGGCVSCNKCGFSNCG
ncbi:MAG: adenosylcobalamin-dependent ribonucleoside-diphosphate reductase [Ruminococcus flavefaciens]|nr:adenosylcobalamin-dependent ribonucleoside-diphosphate reductase [Ruminococcus flavefaciens]